MLPVFKRNLGVGVRFKILFRTGIRPHIIGIMACGVRLVKDL